MAKRGVNKVLIVGNLGGEPLSRTMPNGNTVTNLTVATSETWKDKQSGQQQERTEWHRVALHGTAAEIACQYAKKGSQVYVEGQLQTREFVKDGIKRSVTEIVVDLQGEFQLLGASPEGARQVNPPSTQANRSPAAPQRQSRPQPSPQPATDFDDFEVPDYPF